MRRYDEYERALELLELQTRRIADREPARHARMTASARGGETSRYRVPTRSCSPGITKLDLASYYADIAETMLPLVAGRPLNLERYPDGIGGHKIFQQHAPKHFPDWIKRVETPKSGGTVSTSSPTTRRRSCTSPTRA